VTGQVIASLVPPPMPASLPGGAATTRRALPVAHLAPRPDQSVLCGTAAIDCNGRITEATVIPALGWVPGTRLDIRVHGGLVLLAADPHAVFRITRPGQVRLPATVRHWCGLTPGSRVLLTADVDAGRLVVHPPAALHDMIAQFHATVWGGAAA